VATLYAARARGTLTLPTPVHVMPSYAHALPTDACHVSVFTHALHITIFTLLTDVTPTVPADDPTVSADAHAIPVTTLCACWAVQTTTVQLSNASVH